MVLLSVSVSLSVCLLDNSTSGRRILMKLSRGVEWDLTVVVLIHPAHSPGPVIGKLLRILRPTP